MVRTFEPGGWEGGAPLRRLLLDGTAQDPRTELLLFLADRSGHLRAVIEPALAASKLVLCERYSDSTLAYQCWGRGLEMDFVLGLLELCGFVRPDLTILLDIDPDEAARRLAERGRADSIEAGGMDFMRRVAEGYRELARRDPDRIITVDASGTEDEVAAFVEAAVCRGRSAAAGWGTGCKT